MYVLVQSMHAAVQSVCVHIHDTLHEGAHKISTQNEFCKCNEIHNDFCGACYFCLLNTKLAALA